MVGSSACEAAHRPGMALGTGGGAGRARARGQQKKSSRQGRRLAWRRPEVDITFAGRHFFLVSEARRGWFSVCAWWRAMPGSWSYRREFGRSPISLPSVASSPWPWPIPARSTGPCRRQVTSGHNSTHARRHLPPRMSKDARQTHSAPLTTAQAMKQHKRRRLR